MADDTRKPIPVILDTDIGDDIDDTWALAMILKSPELDLKLVVTDYGDTVYRAKLAARLLEVAGRTDVPVGVGLRTAEKGGVQGPWVEDYDLAKYPGTVHDDGVQALIDAIMSAEERTTLVSIGPMPNVGAALEREPRIAERARFVGMYGSVRRGGGRSSGPIAEYNAASAPAALRATLAAPWDTTITPLDTCGRVRLTGEKYGAVRDCDDPVTSAVIENYRIWAQAHDADAESASSTLFDTVAVYLAFSDELLVMERLGIRVTDEGRMLVDDEAKPVDCAMQWRDLPAFEDLLVDRLTAFS